MKLVLLGGGGHGAVVAEALQTSSAHVLLGFMDDNPMKSKIVRFPHLGGIASAWSSIDQIDGIVLGVGNSSLRRQWLKSAISCGLVAPTIVHSSAWVSPSAKLGSGVVVMAGAIIQARVEIGDGTIINTGASVDHDCKIGICSHLAPGSRLAGEVLIGDDVIIGMMACVIEGRRIGAGALVAAGAVVVRDVAMASRVAGVPARLMKKQDHS